MKNTTELIGHYGSDIVHALSAWTSTSRDLSPEKMDRIPKLLGMLARDQHHTPFEKSTFHFLVNVDQATHIHLLKHRIGVSINGESARYKELKEDKFLIPDDWDNIETISTKGMGVSNWSEILSSLTEASNRMYHDCLEELTPILGRARAKESARYFKMMNSQITMDISFNWRSFYNFYHLRSSEHAQKEIRELAEAMLEQIKDIPENPFKLTLEAFNL